MATLATCHLVFEVARHHLLVLEVARQWLPSFLAGHFSYELSRKKGAYVVRTAQQVWISEDVMILPHVPLAGSFQIADIICVQKIAMKNVATTEPVVMAVPHQAGFPNSISAPVKVIALPSSSEPSSSVHVPFDWVKKYGLKTTHVANPIEKAEKRKQKFGEHVHHVTQAQQVRRIPIASCFGYTSSGWMCSQVNLTRDFTS